MSQRAKGQEVEIVLLKNGAPQENVILPRSASIEWQTEILQEGYLGETTDRFDSVFKGVKGKIDGHTDDPYVFAVMNAIVDKARRREPGTTINIKMTIAYPSGKRVRVVVPNAEFGPMPVNISGRSEFIGVSFDYAASEAKALPI